MGNGPQTKFYKAFLRGNNMKKYVAYEKLSKKEKRKIDNGRRKTWGDLNPVTRKPTSSRVYNRKKNQHWKDELHSTDSFSL